LVLGLGWDQAPELAQAQDWEKALGLGSAQAQDWEKALGLGSDWAWDPVSAQALAQGSE
jgi:hypothetical protein